MNTKERLLNLLLDSKGKYLSGEEIADSLCISRTSVWKAVNSLKQMGYDISAVTKKGYCLSSLSDVVSKQSIAKYINPEYDFLDINTVSSITSTNSFVRQKALDSVKEGFLMVSEEQTEGRGRRGRAFFSPEGTGVYFSLLLRPYMYDVNKASSITTMAAVAVCEAIEKVSGKSPKIKWVNDVFLDGKKVCGILTEASYDLESHFCDYAVLGIGINVYSPRFGFPDDIKNIATCVFDSPTSDGKSKLVAYVINSFLNYYLQSTPSSYIASYKEKCFVLGNRINVISPNETRQATAIDLDNNCHLIVKYDDDTTEVLSSGEISIRL